MVVKVDDSEGPSASRNDGDKKRCASQLGKEGPTKPMGFCFCSQMNRIRSFTLRSQFVTVIVTWILRS